MIGASADSVAMVEGEFDEISEEEMLDAIAFGHEAIKEQIKATNCIDKRSRIKRNSNLRRRR